MKSTAPKKHVLVIAGEFPPIKTIGRIRTAKFVQHLQNEGWNPVVLTIETTPSTYDKSLEDEIPTDIPVYRTRKIDLEQLIVSALKPAKYLKNHSLPSYQKQSVRADALSTVWGSLRKRSGPQCSC